MAKHACLSDGWKLFLLHSTEEPLCIERFSVHIHHCLTLFLSRTLPKLHAPQVYKAPDPVRRALWWRPQITLKNTTGVSIESAHNMQARGESKSKSKRQQGWQVDKNTDHRSTPRRPRTRSEIICRESIICSRFLARGQRRFAAFSVGICPNAHTPPSRKHRRGEVSWLARCAKGIAVPKKKKQICIVRNTVVSTTKGTRILPKTTRHEISSRATHINN